MKKIGKRGRRDGSKRHTEAVTRAETEAGTGKKKKTEVREENKGEEGKCG